MNALRLQGHGAQILWGYQLAVSVSDWTLQTQAPTPEGPPPAPWVFEGTVVTSALVAARQRPLTLVIPRQSGTWRWPVRDLTLTNHHVVAQLGPKEIEPYVALRAAGNRQAGSERG